MKKPLPQDSAGEEHDGAPPRYHWTLRLLGECFLAWTGMVVFTIAYMLNTAGLSGILGAFALGFLTYKVGRHLGYPKEAAFFGFAPTVLLLLGGAWGALNYARGTAELEVTYYGLFSGNDRYWTEHANLKPDLRVPLKVTRGGCMPSPPWLPSEAYRQAAIWCMRTFGPMRTAYLGDFPTRKQAVALLESGGDEVDARDLLEGEHHHDGKRFQPKQGYNSRWGPALNRHISFYRNPDSRVRVAGVGTCVVVQALDPKVPVIFLFEASSGDLFARYWMGE